MECVRHQVQCLMASLITSTARGRVHYPLLKVEKRRHSQQQQLSQDYNTIKQQCQDFFFPLKGPFSAKAHKISILWTRITNLTFLVLSWWIRLFSEIWSRLSTFKKLPTHLARVHERQNENVFWSKKSFTAFMLCVPWKNKCWKKWGGHLTF